MLSHGKFRKYESSPGILPLAHTMTLVKSCSPSWPQFLYQHLMISNGPSRNEPSNKDFIASARQSMWTFPPFEREYYLLALQTVVPGYIPYRAHQH